MTLHTGKVIIYRVFILLREFVYACMYAHIAVWYVCTVCLYVCVPNIILLLLLCFTASEYCSWVLYLSLPVLEGLLPEPYFTHYSLLVAAMHILLGQSLSFHSLQMAEKYLLRFYEMLSPLYGRSNNAQCIIRALIL